MVDNRGCFDIQVLPNFDIDLLPFAVCKGRKGISIINLKSMVAEKFLVSEEMQTHSSFEKMIFTSPPEKLTNSGVGTFILTYTLWRDKTSVVE